MADKPKKDNQKDNDTRNMDEVMRKMLNTPPDPRNKKPKPKAD